jgi:catechol 2,3-dioxygenase-like lactoylglutathione lyase family enzyme
MIKSISKITTYVCDCDEALAFYIDVLGFEKRMDNIMGPPGSTKRWLTVGLPGQALEIVLFDPRSWLENGALDAAIDLIGKQPMMIFDVADIDALLAHLKAKNVRLETPQVRELPWGRDIVFHDLYGNRINAVQVKTPPQ